MNYVRSSLLATVVALATAPGLNAQTTATTEPVGFVTINVAAGTGSSKTTSLVSIPLLDTTSITGQAAGQITGVTANSISNSNAGWGANELSTAAAPYLIQIKSGAAIGSMFLISTTTPNTATTVTISDDDVAQGAIDARGIQVGDAYSIYPCDTLSSFFGTPATTGVLGGANAKVADSLVFVFNGTPKTYFYSTLANRWTENRPGLPDASNVALRPYYGLQYSRLPATDLSFVVTGGVPTTLRSVAIKNSGTTLLSQYWPVESTVSGLGLQAMPGWQSGANAKIADTLLIQASSGATPKTYFYNGSNWVENRPGLPVSNTNAVPVGASIQVTKRGSAAGYTDLSQPVPYNLQ